MRGGSRNVPSPNHRQGHQSREVALVARPRGSRDPGPGAAPGEAAGITAGKRVLDCTAAQRRRVTPDLYPLEPWCIVDYGKRYRAGLRVATALAESAVNSLVGKRMVKKAADAVVAPRREYAHAGSNCGGKW